MITLIHGENELQVRKELQLLKDSARGKELVVLLKPDALTLRQQLASTNMFYDDRLIIVEQFFEKGVGEEVVSFLASLPVDTRVIFVERKQLDGRGKAETGSTDKKSKKGQVLKGKKLLEELKKHIPLIKIIVCNDYSLFNFLDDLTPGNSQKILKDYQALLDTDYAAEEVYYMIVDHIRYLVIANDQGAAGLAGMHQFRQGKIVGQAKRFSTKQIISIYQKLFQLETAQKLKRVGEGSPFSMEEDLQFFLATSFAK